MKTYKIRWGLECDCDAIAAIYAPYVTDSVVSFEEVAPDGEEMWKRMQKSFEKHAWLVCECEGAVAGFAYAGVHRQRKAYQWVAETSIYVHEDHRKEGVATALYNALHEVLREQGYVLTYAGMTLPNIPSKGFHENFGYEPFAVYENSGFKFGQWHSTGWWRRPLCDLPAQPQEIKTIRQLDQRWVDRVFSEAVSLMNHVE